MISFVSHRSETAKIWSENEGEISEKSEKIVEKQKRSEKLLDQEQIWSENEWKISEIKRKNRREIVLFSSANNVRTKCILRAKYVYMWKRCKHVKSQTTIVYLLFQLRQARASMFIYKACVRYNRSRDGQGGKRSGNKQYATTGPPNSAAAGSEVKSARFEAGGRMLMWMVLLVGLEVEGWRSPVAATPAVSAAARGQVEPACATGWPLRGGLAGSVSLSPSPSPSLGERIVLTAPALSRRPGTAAAAHCPGGAARSGPATAPPVVWWS